MKQGSRVSWSDQANTRRPRDVSTPSTKGQHCLLKVKNRPKENIFKRKGWVLRGTEKDPEGSGVQERLPMASCNTSKSGVRER